MCLVVLNKRPYKRFLKNKEARRKNTERKLGLFFIGKDDKESSLGILRPLKAPLESNKVVLYC